MPIIVRGVLVVQRKRGRKGEFNVGDLSTEIGEFEVKDALIEEYEPGRYSGEFVVKWIEPDSFSWRGRVFVKNRASLDAIYIDEADETGEANEVPSPPEPDPAEACDGTPIQQAPAEPRLEAPSGNLKPMDTPSVSPTDAGTSPDGADGDELLFGAELIDLVASRQPIKLDPTIDRVQFRRQRDRLKELGYTFNVKSQSWSCEET